jgi:hypothetical protein
MMSTEDVADLVGKNKLILLMIVGMVPHDCIPSPDDCGSVRRTSHPLSGEHYHHVPVPQHALGFDLVEQAV